MKTKHWILLIFVFLLSSLFVFYIGYSLSDTEEKEAIDEVYMEEPQDERLSYSFIDIPDSILGVYDIYELCYIRSGYWKLHMRDVNLRPMFIGFKSMPSYEQMENWPSVRYLIDLAKYHVKAIKEQQVYENEYAVVFIMFCK